MVRAVWLAWGMLCLGAGSALAQIGVGLPDDGGIMIHLGVNIGGGPALEPGAAWPALGHDGARGSSNMAVGPGSGRPLWFVSLGAAVGAPVVSADGTVFVGSANNKLNALDCGGKLLWQFDATGPVLGAPAIAPDASLIFASSDGTLYGLRSDGTRIWSHTLGSSVSGSVTPMSDGTYCVLTVDGKVHVVRADGSMAMEQTMTAPDDGPMGALTVGSPATGPDGTLYGASSAELWASQPTGSIRWRFRPAGGHLATGPAVATDGTVYVAVVTGNQSQLVAIDPASGTPRWSLDGPPAPVADAPAISPNGDVILAGAGQVVAAKSDGSPSWSFATEGQLPATGTPAVDADGNVYVSVANHGLHALASDGRERWVAVDLDLLDSAPALGADGTIYFPTGPLSQTLFALGPGSTNAGDLNGDGRVSIADATLALRIAIGLQQATAIQITHGDITPKPGLNGSPYGGKGSIGIPDAVKMLRHALGLNPGCAFP